MTKWYEDLAMFMFNVVLLVVLYAVNGIELVVIYGIAKVLTELWRIQLTEGYDGKRTKTN